MPRSMFVRSWPEAELERGADVRLFSNGKQRNAPALVSNVAYKTKTRSDEDVCIHGDVILAPTLGKIAGIEDPVPKFEADFLAGAKPVVRADLFALCGASDPCAD